MITQNNEKALVSLLNELIRSFLGYTEQNSTSRPSRRLAELKQQARKKIIEGLKGVSPLFFALTGDRDFFAVAE